MKPYKIIFLDVDGVLNHHDSFAAAMMYEDRAGATLDERGWCPKSIAALKRCLDETGADIVLSSTWRYTWERTQRCFERAGLPVLEFRTPDLTRAVGSSVAVDSIRGVEIKAWLDEHLYIFGYDMFRYVIIDDDSDMLPEQMSFLVQTSSEHGGFTAEHAERVIEILNGG